MEIVVESFLGQPRAEEYAARIEDGEHQAQAE